MGILDRLNLLVRANLNDMSNGGPQDQLREIERSIGDARRQHAELRRDEQTLVAQIREARDRADGWEERAILALRNDEEDLAREALQVKNRTLREVERLRNQLDSLRRTAGDIERALEALELKLDGARGRIDASRRSDEHREGGRRAPDERGWDAEMQRRIGGEQQEGPPPSSPGRDRHREQWEARRDRWEEQRRGRRTPTEHDEVFDINSAASTFDRMSSKIDAMEAELEAFQEMDTHPDDDLIDPRRRELETIFSRMERGRQVRSELDELSREARDHDRGNEGRGRDHELDDLKKKFQ